LLLGEAVLLRLLQSILLHHLVALATTGTLPDHEEDEEASHLCGHTVCKVVGHVIWENKTLNQNRKGCLVWVPCPHSHQMGVPCDKLIWVCPHTPPCIKAIPGTTEQEVRGDFHKWFHPFVPSPSVADVY